MLTCSSLKKKKKNGLSTCVQTIPYRSPGQTQRLAEGSVWLSGGCEEQRSSGRIKRADGQISGPRENGLATTISQLYKMNGLWGEIEAPVVGHGQVERKQATLTGYQAQCWSGHRSPGLISFCCITNVYNTGGLRQYRFIIFWKWQSKVKVSVGPHSTCRFFPWPFPASRGCLHALAFCPFLHLQGQ